MEREDQEKYLEISRLWHEHQGEQGVASFICKELKVSGKDLGKVKRMMEKGVIAFDPEGQPFYTISFEDAERAVKSSKEDSAVAEDTVVDTVKGAIAGETKNQTENYLISGKAIWQAYASYAAKKGIDLEELKTKPIHQWVLDSLEKAEKYESLKNKVEALEDELAIYKREVDPVMRVKDAIRLTNEFNKARVIAKMWGFPTRPLVKQYVELLYAYIGGMENVITS